MHRSMDPSASPAKISRRSLARVDPVSRAHRMENRASSGAQPLIVLPGQNFRGGHQGRLPPVFHGEPDARRRHHGLAAAHVPLAQAVHGLAGHHVLHGVGNGPALCPGQGEGQPPVKGPHIHGMARGSRHIPPPLPQQLQAAGQKKQLLKHQPPPGHLQGLRRRRKVDVLICIVYITQLVGLPHLIRQHVRQQLPAGVQPLAGGRAISPWVLRRSGDRWA